MCARLLTGCALLLAVAIGLACGDDDSPGDATPPATATRRVTAAPTRSPAATPAPLHTNPPSAPYVGSGTLAVINARIIDGTGAPPIESGFVFVRDGRIESVGPGAPADTADVVIDAAGRTVMPGLGDGHVHITRTIVSVDADMAGTVNEDGLVPFVHGGITNLREVGTATVIMQSLKVLTDGLVREGRAPRVTWAGPIITTTGGYPFTVQRYSPGGQAVASAEEGVEMVNDLADWGARIIKLGLEQGYYADEGWPLMDLPTVQAITEAAHARGLLVTAHVTSLDEVRLALDGGVDNLAHTPLQLLTNDLIEEMIEADMGIVSTAIIWDPNAAGIAAENVRRYAAAGGTIAIGTDYGCCEQLPGPEALLREMQFLYIDGGVALDDLLVAATRGVAAVTGTDADVGTLEAGKLADMIILGGDPLTEIAALGDVELVIVGGDVVYER